MKHTKHNATKISASSEIF